MTALLRCRICGFTGRNVSSGIFKTNEGPAGVDGKTPVRYVTIARCEDHLACDSRKAAI